MRRRRIVALPVAAALAAAAGGTAAAAPAPVAVTVQAAPGRAGEVERALGRAALRVTRRDGPRLQVTASPRLARSLRAVPGVAAAGPAAPAFADQAAPVLSQGLLRTGANALSAPGTGGEGLVIAVLDLGFGTSLAGLRARGELPSAAVTEERSFDTVNGLAGRNAYGNATNHGELVAQTVFDYAPRARYLFVNYRTTDDFRAAVDWLVSRRPDVVVHSNSFIEGPFDGTGPAARAVDRAAAAGILWLNSAGNYARRHWSGTWSDPDGDGVHDFPAAEGGIFFQAAGRPVTFALSWSQRAAGPRTDLDLILERRSDDATTWTPVAVSEDRQSLGAAPAERIVGYLPAADGFFRLRPRLVSGPVPAGPMTVFSREIDMALFGGSPEGSLPTPGDAAGALTIGAVDWRGDRLETYSSQGPTDDGRLKPDLVAPTDTSLAGPSGPRLVGGTSNAAPNAAGAAALLIGSLRAAGEPSGPAEVRARLAQTAVDLGVPGPDPAHGAGRVRVDLAPPEPAEITPVPDGPPVRGRVTLSVRVADPSAATRLTLSVDGVIRRTVTTRDRIAVALDTTTLADGRHAVALEALDWAGNLGRREWGLNVDNTAPGVAILGSRLAPRGPRIASRSRPAPAARRRPAPARPAHVLVRVREGAGLPVRVTVRVGSGRTRALVVRGGSVRRVPVGRLRPGRLPVRVAVTDATGNTRTVNQVRAFR